jgi:asparagine synthase (glutamine-hydrolysing)
MTAADQDHVKRMSRALSHRGPDGQGLYKASHCLLAHRRLSIIDPSGGDQPIISEAGNAIVYNGMINNYRELREELAQKEFKTDSDTEVLLALYEEEGPEFVDKIRGMYALAIHNKKTDTLILARDRYGIKPLYYATKAGKLYFASEPDALIKTGLAARKLSRDKAVELLQLKFTTGTNSIYEGISRVEPGEMLFIQQGKIIRRERQDGFAATPHKSLNFKTGMGILDKKLVETAAIYARSDVPFGVFLSGGVDSCAIVAALAKAGIKDYPCYTACFPGSDLHDETVTAGAVAQKAGTQHIKVPIDEHDFWRALNKVVTCVDDPSMDPAMVANYVLTERAAQDVKVILGGDGGDEIFGGYRRYERAQLPAFIKSKEMRSRGQFDQAEFALFKNENWRADYAEIVTQAKDKTGSRLQAYQATDGADFLPHFHLMKFDRCLMAHGVEGRAPLLDQDLAAFGFRLPDRLKLRGQKGKWLVRKWLQANMPEAKPFARKRGFSVPVNDWIAARGPALAPFICDQAGVREMFDINGVRKLYSVEPENNKKFLWPVLYYALWHQIHIERGPVPDWT